MSKILGNYSEYVERAQSVAREFTEPHELTQCDMLNYECNTNERYDEVKAALLRSAKLLSEIEHGGRLISIFQMAPALRAGELSIPYVELLQPKPTRENIDGIDSVFFVTSTDIHSFVTEHAGLDFEQKGLSNRANPYVELKTDGVAVKFHDRHMGAVLGIERTFIEPPITPPNYGNHVTL